MFISRYRAYFILILLLLLGFALRLYQLDHVALRGDEAFSVQRWTAAPLTYSLTEIASLEPHPPLTYVIFRLWGVLFGIESVFVLRLLPLLINLLGIAALYALAYRLSMQRAHGLLAAFFWAIHPFQIWHAQDFRNYGIWAGISLITLWLAYRLITGRRRTVDWFLYLSFASLSALIFYNELIMIGTLGLYVWLFHWRERPFVMRWSLYNGLLIVGVIAVFLIFQGDLLSSGGYGGTTGSFEVVQLWQRFIPVLNFGETLSRGLQEQFTPQTAWWWLIVSIISCTMIYTGYRVPQRSRFLIFIAIVPLIALSVISLRLAIFRPRYILSAAPAYTLIISDAISILWKMRWRRPLAVMTLGIWVILSGISLNHYYHDASFAKAPNWHSLVSYLERETQANDLIIQTSVDASFGYYYDLATITAVETALPTNFDQPSEDIIAHLEQVSADFDSLWILGQTFPDWPNAGVVENWAFDHMQLVRETHIAGVPVRQFMNWTVSPSQLDERTLARYGTLVSLGSVHIFDPDPDDTLTVLAYWHALRQSAVSYKTFAHLVRFDLPNPQTGTYLWSQDDHLPQQGRIDSTQWRVGDWYRERYVLSLETVQSGHYEVYIGWYDPETGQRLRLAEGSDAMLIGTIMID